MPAQLLPWEGVTPNVRREAKTPRQAIVEAAAVIAAHRKRAADRWPYLFASGAVFEVPDWTEADRLQRARAALLEPAWAGISTTTALELVRAETVRRTGAEHDPEVLGTLAPNPPFVYTIHGERRDPWDAERSWGRIAERIGLTLFVAAVFFLLLYVVWTW